MFDSHCEGLWFRSATPTTMRLRRETLLHWYGTPQQTTTFYVGPTDKDIEAGQGSHPSSLAMATRIARM